MRTMLLSALLLLSLPLFAALPPKAQSYLDKTPRKKLTLPVVVKAAIENSDAFQILSYDYASADLEEMALGAYTDTNFQLNGGYRDDNSVIISPMMPSRTKNWNYQAGLQKNWLTGTSTSIGWTSDSNNLEYPDDPATAAFASFFLKNYKQSAASVQVSQDLLKNSFGFSFRKRMEGARKRSQAIQWKTRSNVEALTLQFIYEFYGAWLAQQQVRSIASQVRRQQRLVRVLTKRSRKGVVEKPELIQFQALLAATQSRESIARAALSSQWEKLVVGLKLPLEFLQIDPMEVPTAIDNPVELSLRLCSLKDPYKTADIYALEKNLEALDSDFKASKNDALPDLKLIAGYRGNSIENKSSDAFQNVISGSDSNGFGRGPSWNVGLKLNWSLDNSSNRADRARKYINKERTTAQLRVAVDNLKTQWMNSCRRLRMEADNEATYSRVVKQQASRVTAEEKRFSLGRINVNQLVTAEDDLGSWEFMSQQKSVEVRQLAWQVQKTSGEMYKTLSPFIEKMMTSERP